MEPHRVPRHVHMDQHGATLLQVNTLTTRLGRNQEADLAGIEHVGCIFSWLMNRLDGTRRLLHPIEPFIAIDERCAAETRLPLQCVNYQCLSSFIFGEQQYWLVRWEFTADHQQKPLYFRLNGYL